MLMPEYHYPGDNGLPASPLSWWTRVRLRASWWPYMVLALLFGGWLFWKYRSPSVAMKHMTPLDDYFLAILFFGGLAVIRGAQVLVRYSAEIECGLPHQFSRLRNWCLPWLFLIAAGIYFGIGEEWPMRASFWWSRSAFDRLADEALADPDNAHLLGGRWAGLYRIDRVEVTGPIVSLYLDKVEGISGFGRGLVPAHTSEIGKTNVVGLSDWKQLNEYWFAYRLNDERG